MTNLRNASVSKETLSRERFLAGAAAVALAPALRWVPEATAAPTTCVENLARALHPWRADYPLLARAIKNAAPAYSSRIEWMVDRPREAWANYTQILRHAMGVTGTYRVIAAAQGSEGAGFPPELRREQLRKHLAAIENVLWNGKPSYTAGEFTPRPTAGGVRNYLGRNPERGDFLQLRVLGGGRPHGRDLRWTEWTDGGDGLRADWLSEISLVVIPKGRRR